MATKPSKKKKSSAWTAALNGDPNAVVYGIPTSDLGIELPAQLPSPSQTRELLRQLAKERLGWRDPVREKVIGAMHASRTEDKELTDFLDAAKAGSIDGIEEFTLDDDGKYSIVCCGIPGEKLVKLSTLQKWWTAAGVSN
ncbi:MAG TPA: hypothetical protein VMF03_00225 [Steroidobacteraceae bacterium]|nr:hypothetical protein [Steroidobacteraceae bacterium]